MNQPTTKEGHISKECRRIACGLCLLLLAAAIEVCLAAVLIDLVLVYAFPSLTQSIVEIPWYYRLILPPLAVFVVGDMLIHGLKAWRGCQAKAQPECHGHCDHAH